MQVIPGGLRLPKKSRAAAWRTLAIAVLALAFPATALGAGTGPAQSTTSASARASGAPSRAVHARLNHSVLALGSGYGSPSGSPLVRVLQRDLGAAGYPPGDMDGLYGPRTRHAVVAFQMAHGLQVDGVVGSRTWSALSEPVLILGPGAGDQAGGESVVRSLQRRLASAGTSPGPIDGRYGVLTEAAVRRFQRAHGLPVTGIAGPRTLALLAKPEPSVRRSNPLPQTPAPSATRSNLSSRPTGSTVAPAPRERPASAARTGAPRISPPAALGKRAVDDDPGRSGARAGIGTRCSVADRFAPASALAQRWPVSRRGEGGRRCEIGAARADGPHHAERRPRSPRPNQRDPDSHQRAKRQRQCGWHRQWRKQPAVSGTNGRSPRAGTDRWRFQPRSALAGQGGVVKAHAANGHADQRDHGTAASNLGRLLEEQGALAEAEAAYRRADELGDSCWCFPPRPAARGPRGHG